MHKLSSGIALFGAILLMVACSEQKSGPVEVKWDRDVGQRCMMVLSDRYHAAQIRHNLGNDSEVFKFDDIGCAILWLEEQSWKGDDSIEFWVNDHRDGNWIDARSAWYVDGHTTPMEYGLGAQLEQTDGAVDFIQARSRVIALDQRYNQHGSELKALGEERMQHKHSGSTEPMSSEKSPVDHSGMNH